MLQGNRDIAGIGYAVATAFGVGIFIGVGDDEIRVFGIIFDG